MAKNVLFNFIEHYPADIQALLPNYQRLEKASNTKEHQYYRFELHHPHPVVLECEQSRYTLLNHHVSVYQTESQANPFLSQYHYTAHFKDQAGVQYQLHVYFNDKNGMTTKPVFSIWHETDGFMPIENEILHEDFINLACANAKPLIKTIRKQLIEKVRMLEARYKKLEIEASLLSTSLAANYGNYIAKLTEISATLKLLSPIVKYEHYQNIYTFIQRMITAVAERYKQQPPTQEIQSTLRRAGEESNTGTVSKAPSPQPNHPSVITATGADRQPAGSSTFDLDIVAITAQFDKFSSDNTEVATTRLGDLLARVHALSLELDDPNTVASLDSLARLKDLHQKLHETGEKLFVRLLMGNQFKLAERLPYFYYLLDNYLNIALQTRNHQLLDFILQHGEININNQEVSVKGKIYSSAVHCCLGCDTETTPMVQCLAVLIKHGASLFVTDEHGLPIAHTILSTLGHPLKKALHANRDKTIESIAFYKQLISILKLYLAENQPPRITQASYDSVTEAIIRYQSHIEALKSGIVPANPSEKRVKDKLANFMDKHDTTALERVRQDPEVIALKQRLQKETKAFLSRLTPVQSRKFTKMSSHYLDNLDQMLDYFGIKFSDYEATKKESLDYLYGSLDLVAKQMQLLDLQEDIRRYTIKPGSRPPQRYRELLQQQKELIAEITKMENEYAVEDMEEVRRVEPLVASLSLLQQRLPLLSGLEEDSNNNNRSGNNVYLVFSPFFQSLKGIKEFDNINIDNLLEPLSEEGTDDITVEGTNPTAQPR